MSQINVNNLTFCYEESIENVFENVTFSIDTNWKLGLIGRNGKGKTTLTILTYFQECRLNNCLNPINQPCWW